MFRSGSNTSIHFKYVNQTLAMMALKKRLIARMYICEPGNGSIKNIAGIFNKQKNVLGMMPHPERMIDPSLSGEDGSLFFNNLINNLK